MRSEEIVYIKEEFEYFPQYRRAYEHLDKEGNGSIVYFMQDAAGMCSICFMPDKPKIIYTTLTKNKEGRYSVAYDDFFSIPETMGEFRAFVKKSAKKVANNV